MNGQLANVLRQYPDVCQPASEATVQSLGSAGGFSGAAFWRWSSLSGNACLKLWPAEHPAPERLDWIHRVLRHAAAQGIALLPVPWMTHSGESFVRAGGRLWELTPWLPGQAADQPVSQLRTVAAFDALARLHTATAGFGPAVHGPAGSPGLSERHDQLLRLVDGEIHRIRMHCRPTIGGAWNELCPLAVDVLDSFDLLAADVDRMLRRARELDVPIIPCVRDVRREHVLFTGDEVTGLVDFGSMRPETVAADVSRLLVELCGSSSSRRSTALASYEAVRPLDDNERQLLGAFEVSGTLLGAINWLTWLFVEVRHFSDRDAVIKRFEQLARRLAGLAEPFNEPDEAI